MTTQEQAVALRKAITGVQSARPGAARQYMVKAMLGKAMALAEQKVELDAYLEKGVGWLAKHDLAREPPRDPLRSDLTRAVGDEQFAEDARWRKYRQALDLHAEVCAVLREAEAAITPRRAVA